MKSLPSIIILFFLGFSGWLTAQEAIELKSDEIFGSMKARQIGPAIMSGRITDLEGHPTDPKVIYAGTAGGGVWKSTNSGVTFNSIFDKHAQSIGTVTVDPNQPDKIVWVGSGETWTRNSVSVGDGIYKSTDGGQSWNNMGLFDSERISDIIVMPGNSDIVYVGVMGALWGDNDERGVYKTTDGGITWNRIFFINETTGCSELVMDPSNPEVLYAAFWEFRRTAYSFNSGGVHSALYKSMDGGTTWSKIHNGFPEGKLGRIAMAVAPSDPNRLYAVLETERDSDKGLYRSDDGGQSWRKTSSDFELIVRPFYFSRIVVDPKNPDIVLKAGLSGSMSRDGGITFRSIGGGMHADLHDFWFNPLNSDHIYAGTDGGVYRSWDGGSVWEMVKGLPVSQYYHVSYDNQKPYNIYGGLQDNGSWVGPSQKPGGVENRDWIRVGYGDGFRVYPHPEDPNTVYSEMQGAANIWRVDIAKNQIKTIKPYAEAGDPDLRFNWNAPLSTSYHHPDRLYVGSQFVHVSDDRGESWRKMSPDLTTNDPAKQNQSESGGLSVDNSGAENHCTIFTINESPIDKNVIWVGTDDGNVQVTMDGGLSWKNVTGNITGVPKNTWVYFIEPSHFDTKTAYVVFDGHTQNDFKPYALKTTDGGESWTSVINGDIHGFTRSLVEDPVNPNLLFLGTEFGLYITVDGGMNWIKFENNMPAAAVFYLTLNPEEDALIMATHGRGIIIIDDVSPLRHITPTLLEKELAFIPSKPTVIYEKNSFGNYSAVGEFVGPNPSTAAQISYFLLKRHTFGKMTMEIFDANGMKVADISPGKSKGINTVEWNYTLRPPKVAKGKTFTFGGFSGPRLSEGIYTVKITKGQKVYEDTIQLLYDPTSIYTAEERETKQKATMKLYKMTEDLAYAVDQLDHLQSGAESLLLSLQDDKRKLRNLKLQDYISSIENLRRRLVITTGDNYVASAEPQLREKISELYGEVVGYPGKPSLAQLNKMNELSSELDPSLSAVANIVAKAEELNKTLEKAGNTGRLGFRSLEDFMND